MADISRLPASVVFARRQEQRQASLEKRVLARSPVALDFARATSLVALAHAYRRNSGSMDTAAFVALVGRYAAIVTDHNVRRAAAEQELSQSRALWRVKAYICREAKQRLLGSDAERLAVVRALRAARERDLRTWDALAYRIEYGLRSTRMRAPSQLPDATASVIMDAISGLGAAAGPYDAAAACALAADEKDLSTVAHALSPALVPHDRTAALAALRERHGCVLLVRRASTTAQGGADTFGVAAGPSGDSGTSVPAVSRPQLGRTAANSEDSHADIYGDLDGGSDSVANLLAMPSNSRLRATESANSVALALPWCCADAIPMPSLWCTTPALGDLLAVLCPDLGSEIKRDGSMEARDHAQDTRHQRTSGAAAALTGTSSRGDGFQSNLMLTRSLMEPFQVRLQRSASVMRALAEAARHEAWLRATLGDACDVPVDGAPSALSSSDHDGDNGSGFLKTGAGQDALDVETLLPARDRAPFPPSGIMHTVISAAIATCRLLGWPDFKRDGSLDDASRAAAADVLDGIAAVLPLMPLQEQNTKAAGASTASYRAGALSGRRHELMEFATALASLIARGPVAVPMASPTPLAVAAACRAIAALACLRADVELVDAGSAASSAREQPCSAVADRAASPVTVDKLNEYGQPTNLGEFVDPNHQRQATFVPLGNELSCRVNVSDSTISAWRSSLVESTDNLLKVLLAATQLSPCTSLVDSGVGAGFRDRAFWARFAGAVVAARELPRGLQADDMQIGATDMHMLLDDAACAFAAAGSFVERPMNTSCSAWSPRDLCALNLLCNAMYAAGKPLHTVSMQRVRCHNTHTPATLLELVTTEHRRILQSTLEKLEANGAEPPLSVALAVVHGPSPPVVSVAQLPSLTAVWRSTIRPAPRVTAVSQGLTQGAPALTALWPAVDVDVMRALTSPDQQRSQPSGVAPLPVSKLQGATSGTSATKARGTPQSRYAHEALTIVAAGETELVATGSASPATIARMKTLLDDGGGAALDELLRVINADRVVRPAPLLPIDVTAPHGTTLGAVMSAHRAAVATINDISTHREQFDGAQGTKLHQTPIAMSGTSQVATISTVDPRVERLEAVLRRAKQLRAMAIHADADTMVTAKVDAMVVSQQRGDGGPFHGADAKMSAVVPSSQMFSLSPDEAEAHHSTMDASDVIDVQDGWKDNGVADMRGVSVSPPQLSERELAVVRVLASAGGGLYPPLLAATTMHASDLAAVEKLREYIHIYSNRASIERRGRTIQSGSRTTAKYGNTGDDDDNEDDSDSVDIRTHSSNVDLTGNNSVTSGSSSDSDVDSGSHSRRVSTRQSTRSTSPAQWAAAASLWPPLPLRSVAVPCGYAVALKGLLSFDAAAARVAGSDTAAWRVAMARLALSAEQSVPGLRRLAHLDKSASKADNDGTASRSAAVLGALCASLRC